MKITLSTDSEKTDFGERIGVSRVIGLRGGVILKLRLLQESDTE